MSVATVKARLAAIQETISSVGRAYADGPRSLPTSDLPVFVNFTGPAMDDWASLGADYDQETRQYLMRLYVRTVGQGIDGEAETLCEPFFSSVRGVFAARPGLGLGTKDSQLPGVDAIFLGDQGIIVLSYAGVEYIGIEFRLQVTETIRRTMANFE